MSRGAQLGRSTVWRERRSWAVGPETLHAVLIIARTLTQRGDDARVGERGSQCPVFLVEDATGVRERSGLVAGFVSLLSVALRALLGGGVVAGETRDPRLCLVGMVGRWRLAGRVAPGVNDRRAVGLLAGEAGLGCEVADGEASVGPLRLAGEQPRHRGTEGLVLWSGTGLQWGDDGGVFVSLLCDPFSLVAGYLAAQDRIVEQLVGVGDDASPAGEVVVVD